MLSWSINQIEIYLKMQKEEQNIKAINFFEAECPLSSNIADATHTIPAIKFIIAEVELARGITGEGYLLSFHYSSNAIKGALADIKEFILKNNYIVSDTVKLYDDWTNESEYFGNEGLLKWAVSVINIAMWDALGKLKSKSVLELLGGRKRKVEIYGSGGWLSYSDKELIQEAVSYKKRGFKSIKIKVGSKTVERDIQRLHKVREAIGNEIRIMMDANQGMIYKNALILAKEAAKIRVVWFEEPFDHRNYILYEKLKKEANIKIAMGEREYDFEALKQLAKNKALDLWQPDLIRIGGVEKWIESAHIANESKIPTLPHYYKDYDVPLLCTINNGYAVESFDWIDGLIDNQLNIIDGYTFPREGVGWGFSFLKEKLIKLNL
jgi:L-alanine-DL-glutamate epimerase-like enolase superfamily enzyme